MPEKGIFSRNFFFTWYFCSILFVIVFCILDLLLAEEKSGKNWKKFQNCKKNMPKKLFFGIGGIKNKFLEKKGKKRRLEIWLRVEWYQNYGWATFLAACGVVTGQRVWAPPAKKKFFFSNFWMISKQRRSVNCATS